MEFEKYRKIYVIGHDENKEIFANPEDEIVIEEKIDGGNFRFMISEGKVIFGSHTQELKEDTANLKFFQMGIDWVRERIKDKDLTPYNNLICYGEYCVKHTINYDWDKIPRFLGFDIKNSVGYVNYPDVKQVYETMGLDFVPVINVCKAKEITKIDDSIVPLQKYPLASAQDQYAEGVVFKNYSKQIMAKYVRDKFKERNAEAFGGNPKYNKVDDTDNAEFVFKYCTNARIDKMIFKLIAEGNKLDMPLMGLLPKRINLDIWEENWQEIRDSNWKLDIAELRRLIPKRCAAVLKQVITNNALGAKDETTKEM